MKTAWGEKIAELEAGKIKLQAENSSYYTQIDLLLAEREKFLEACMDILPFLDRLMGVRCLQTAAKYGGTTFDAREAIRAAIKAAEVTP